MERKTLLLSILALRRKMTHVYHKYLSTAREYYPGENLYMREVHVVMEIGLHGLDNVGVLSERLQITNGAVSQYLSKLEQKGFLHRIQDAADKRQYSVHLTEKGKKLYQQHLEYDNKNYCAASKLFSEFTEKELEMIYQFDKRFAEFVQMMGELDKAEETDQ